jgi:hypothetical protein
VTAHHRTTAEVASPLRVDDDRAPLSIQGRRRFPTAAVAELAQQRNIPLVAWLRAATATREEPR